MSAAQRSSLTTDARTACDKDGDDVDGDVADFEATAEAAAAAAASFIPILALLDGEPTPSSSYSATTLLPGLRAERADRPSSPSEPIVPASVKPPLSSTCRRSGLRLLLTTRC